MLWPLEGEVRRALTFFHRAGLDCSTRRVVSRSGGRGREANRTSLRVILSGAVGAPALLVLVRHAKLGVLFTAVHAGVLMHGTAVGTRSSIRRTAGFALLPVELNRIKSD